VEDEERFFISNFAEHITRRNQLMAHCPECDAQVSLQNLMVGEIIYCPDCNAELEVLNLETPELGLAPQVEEDWGE
jgi:alpha-aminoadipate carrier protein LysW